METSVIYGPPGTGKTRYLIDTVEEEIRRGVPPNRIAFVSFTKRAVIEAKQRATARFNLREDDLPWFRTLHSSAYKIKGLRRNNVMGKSNYDALASAMGGIKFAHQYDEDTSHAYETGDDGDALLSVYAWARAVGATVETAARHYQTGGGHISYDQIKKFFVWLAAYKHDMGLVDFSDMLEDPPPIPVDVVLLDEAQDNTPQQWRAVDSMFGGARRLYVAGDDDQAIFGWAGADVGKLLEVRGNRRILSQSWRVPAAVHALAQDIVSQIVTRVPKQWAPRDVVGSVLISSIDTWHPNSIDGGTWLVLARNHYSLIGAANRLEALGIPYIIDGKSILERRGVQAVLAYERLRRGEAIGPDSFGKLKRHMSITPVGELGDHSILWDNIVWPFTVSDSRPTWLELVDKKMLRAPERDVMIIRRIRESGESLVKVPKVTVSTIHGSKGAEADNVLLLSNTSRQTCVAMRENPDHEHRVFYVGATRAKKNLVVIPPTRRHYYPLLEI